MLTEQRARDLLHLAADTVEVTQTRPVLASAHRRRWPLVAAAASVVLVVGGVSVLTRDGDPRPDPTQPRVIDDGHFRLGPDQVPSVFGFSEDEAVALLEERGLEVTVSTVSTAPPAEPDCGEVPGRAQRTVPGPGTLVEPGDEVVLEVSAGARPGTAYCAPQPMRAEAWALIDYANGRGPAPGVTDDVDLGPVLAKLREWSAEVGRSEVGVFTVPQLTTWTGTETTCGEQPPQPIDSAQVAITIEVPSERNIFRPCHTVLVQYFHGVIEWVHVPGQQPQVPTHDRVPADVVGNSVQDATSRLEAAGYTVEAIARPDCAPIGIVTAQQPYPEYPPVPFEPDTTVYLAFTDRDGPCIKNRLHIDTPASLAVDQLVAFVAGGEPPPMAETLDLYVGNDLVAQLTGEETRNLDEWPSEVVEVVTRGTYHVTRPFLRDGDACHVVTGRLPEVLTTAKALSHSASFGGSGEPETCAESWEAQLWLDDDGRITALNVLTGDPTATE